ncbi:hypothetical protein [Candidatus Odyssella acanthamoebae]|uniref:Uncharacterized protein n=1 Tax=Candidatus Odyssella acanthamoebae TaxID=91604 RepID=A0A077B0P4_9PROT|nr:hypothetical protein [Candidatus Paracaedibacter acanthamoebae]AIK96490.1 hypothetical protein ID47_06635 [Candidatus Paracaedibacter acanthamoebae]
MQKLIALIILLATPALSICLIDCNTTKCADLNYYMKKCNKCKSVGKKCAASFCANHPELCKNNQPLRPLSVATAEMRDERLHDVCMVPLFAKFTFEGNMNSTLTPDNLNTLNIVFFEQTKGEAHKRNIGSVRNVLANYFALLYPELKTYAPKKASEQVSLMIRMKFGKPLEQCSNLDFHTIIDTVRAEIYKRKGIPLTKASESYQNRNYPVTISKMGCHSEKLFKPIR